MERGALSSCCLQSWSGARAAPHTGEHLPRTQESACLAPALVAESLLALLWPAVWPRRRSLIGASGGQLGLTLLGDLLFLGLPPPICGAKRPALLRGSAHGGLPFPRSGVL